MLKNLAIKVLNLVRYKKSYSQDGEDMVLHSFFEVHSKSYKGFYVDVGAHHPVRFSNTYFFYKKGWRGINIDATPGSISLFDWFRKRDVNLEVGIGPERDNLIFYCFDEPALNTFSKEIAQERASGGRYKIRKEVRVPIQPLSEILEQHLPSGQKIDFLSVDVEGLDEVVLRSNDWTRFRPTFVLAEDSNFQIGSQNFEEAGVYQFLHTNDYTLVAKTQRTLIFKDNRQNVAHLSSN